MPVKVGVTAAAKLIIAGNDVSIHVQRMEWTSFVNGGYMVRGEVLDPNHVTLKKIARGDGDAKVKYLKEGRKKPLPIEFQLIWVGGKKTDVRTAFITNLMGSGAGQESLLEFVAIDPPSFRLNAGVADGRVYTGKVSEVIEKVVKDFSKDIQVSVSKTDDNSKNKFWMMRMDPKTFIGSLIDWSASTSKDKARWIISSKDTKINIKKESDLEGMDLGVYDVASNRLAARDVSHWDLDLNNFVSAYQTQLTTGGISAVSGRYIEAKETPETIVKDETTDQKRNVKTDEDRAFTKPGESDDWPQGLPATFIMSIPEHNAGDVGIEYSKYIDGRARQKFMNMLNMVMKIRIEVDGDYRVDNSELLGVSTCSLMWKDIDDADNLYFLHGCWIVYGFSHQYTSRSGAWVTRLYLYRLDHDASAKLLKCEVHDN